MPLPLALNTFQARGWEREHQRRARGQEGPWGSSTPASSRPEAKKTSCGKLTARQGRSEGTTEANQMNYWAICATFPSPVLTVFVQRSKERNKHSLNFNLLLERQDPVRCLYHLSMSHEINMNKAHRPCRLYSLLIVSTLGSPLNNWNLSCFTSVQWLGAVWVRLWGNPLFL